MKAAPGRPAPTLLFSRLAYGTWRLLDDAEGAEPQPLAKRLELCADLGLTTIDTAEVYGGGRVEERLGAALRLHPALRGRLQLVTKCGIYSRTADGSTRAIPLYDATADQIVASVEKSLRLLGTDRIDALLVHRPDWLTPAGETAAGLERLLRDGKILHAGVSNYLPSQLETLQSRLDAPLVANQVELSLFRLDALTDGTLQQCERMNVAPMAWSPLGGGRLFGEHDPAAVRIRAVCAELAPRYGGASPEALAMAWILALPGRPTVIIGTNKEDRVRAAAKAASIVLQRADWYALWQAAQGRPVP